MSNDYFDTTQNRVTNGSTARAPDVNNVIDSVGAAFDLLPTPAALWSDTQSVGSTGGTVNAITLTVGGSTPVPYIDGQGIIFRKESGDNTGACTLAVDAGSPKPLKGHNGAELVASDLVNGRWYQARFSTSSDEWWLVNDVTTGALDAAVASAETAETNALNHSFSAAASALAASNEKGYAEEWATAAEDTLISVAAGGDGATDYSSLHWAAKAAASASAASTSETNAATEVTYAAEWATKAEDSLISVAAGGDGATDYSALHWAAKAAATVAAKLENIVEDTTPQLGGSLDVNGQVISYGATQVLKIDSTGRSLFGSATPDAVGAEAGSVTISTGNSGVTTPHSDADELVIEGSANAGINVLTPATGTGSIRFGDTGDSDVGYLSYNHSSDKFTLAAAGAAVLEVDADSLNILDGHWLEITSNTTDGNGIQLENSDSTALTYNKNHIRAMDDKLQLGVNNGTNFSNHGLVIFADTVNDDGVEYVELRGAAQGIIYTLGDDTYSGEQLEIAGSGTIRYTTDSESVFNVPVEITSGGLKLDNLGSSDVNTLDDYEEGTFTPVVQGSGTAGVGTYTAQTGTYTKMGNRVHFTIRVAQTAHTGTGNMQITGLPFTSDLGHGVPVVAAGIGVGTVTAGSAMVGFVASSSTRVDLYEDNSGTITNIAMDGSCTLFVQGTYRVA